jgi:hypothetical protein
MMGETTLEFAYSDPKTWMKTKMGSIPTIIIFKDNLVDSMIVFSNGITGTQAY